MAKSLEERKKEKELQKQGQEGGTPDTTAVETTDTPETPVVEESAEEKKRKVQELLNKANNPGGANPVDSMEETKVFGNDGAMTEEEIRAAQQKKAQEEIDKAEKARKAAIREANTAEHNSIIERENSELIEKTKDVTITPEHEQYQVACQMFGRHVGFLMAEGPVPKMGLSMKFKKDATTKEKVARKTVSPDEIRILKTKQKVTAEDNRDHYEFVTDVTYGYSAPKKCFGSIIKIPQVLNITLGEILKGNFPNPTQEQIVNSPKVYIPYSEEGFYSIVSIAFGGKILESDIMAKTKAAIKAQVFALRTHINTVRVKQNGEYTGEVKHSKVVLSESRKSLYVRENIIPYKVYETVKLSELSSAVGADTRTWLDQMFAKKLSAGNGKVAPFTELSENAAKILTGTLNPNTKSVENFVNKLLTGEVMPGVGAAQDIVLRHWSDAELKGDRYQGMVTEAVLPKKVGVPKKDAPTEFTYKQVYKTLGINITLAELGETYPAAKELAQAQFDPKRIAELFTQYQAALKQKRQAQAANKGTTVKTLARKSTLVDTETTQKLIMQQLQGKVVDEKFDFDAESARKSILHSSYIPETK